MFGFGLSLLLGPLGLLLLELLGLLLLEFLGRLYLLGCLFLFIHELCVRADFLFWSLSGSCSFPVSVPFALESLLVEDSLGEEEKMN